MNSTEIVADIVTAVAPSLNKTVGSSNASLITAIVVGVVNLIQLIFHLRSSSCFGKKIIDLQTVENALPAYPTSPPSTSGQSTGTDGKSDVSHSVQSHPHSKRSTKNKKTEV